MQTAKRIVGFTGITLLLSIMLLGLIIAYLEEYDLFSTEPATVTTIEKIGEKSLFKPPVYFVLAELPNKDEAPYHNRISKQQIEQLKVGDTIDGYSSSGSDFSTIRDLVHDSFFFLLAFLIIGFVAVNCLIALIDAFPRRERPARKQQNTKQKLKTKQQIGKKERKKQQREKAFKKEKRRKRIAWGMVGIAALTYLYVIGQVALNLVRKVLPFGKTETEALVLDRNYEISYRKYADSKYEFVISFEDTHGQNFRVIKDVTQYTYQQYSVGDKLPIAYRDANPYDVFVHETSIEDVIQMLFTSQILVYTVITGVVVFSIWAMYKKRKKRR